MLPSSTSLRTLLGRSSLAATYKTARALLAVARRGACCNGTTSSSSSRSSISSIAARGPTNPILLSLPQPEQRYRQSTQQQVHSRAFSSSSPEAAPAKTKKSAGKGERTLLTNLRKSGAPTSALFEALEAKCKGSKLPRLQDLHALLLSTSTSSPTTTKEENKRLILAAVHVFLHKNVEFSEQSGALFFRSMLRADGLGDAVDLLLDRKKRMGLWAQRKTLHLALHKLGGAKDTERLLALWRAMATPVMGIEHTARTYHLVIRGLLNAGEGKKALEMAGKAPMALADSTQEMLKKAVEAEAGVQKEAEEQAQGEGEKEREGEKKDE